jgi:hypothetical protein
MNRRDWNLAKNVINQSKITWALSIFKPFKSAGTDGIVPALLQQGIEHLVPQLCRIFRTCMVYGFVPMAWRQVRVTFIPKPGELDYTEAKAYRPISLSSFLLKTMEKLVDRYIRDGALRIHPLHRNQHAYQLGKSTETALHNVVTRIENAIQYKVNALGAFLDIEGAFGRTSFDTIIQAAGRHGIEPAICRWMCAKLENRNICATLSGETHYGVRREGCSLLCCGAWSWMILFGCSKIMAAIQYDIAILINGKFLHTVSEVLQTALHAVQQWCERTNLSINSNKTVIIPFTRKINIKEPKEPILFSKTIQLSNEDKYLGITLDKGLT